MAFSVNISEFQGPLDLMLHLIKENNMNIFDFDLIVLCDQYLEYIQAMNELQLEVESDYLYELATLIEFKSRKLLPKNDSTLDQEFEEDPQEILVKRLLEYQQFQEVAKELALMYEGRSKKLAKEISIVNEVETFDYLASLDHSANDLLRAMSSLMKRLQLQKPIEASYHKKELSVDDKILEIKAKLFELPKTFTFDNLISENSEKEQVIVTFLAILDLCKSRVLNFTVGLNEVIYLRKVVLDE